MYPTIAWLLPASWPSPAVVATVPAVFANWPDFAGFAAVAPNFAAVGSAAAGFGIAIADFGSDFASTDFADSAGFVGFSAAGFDFVVVAAVAVVVVVVLAVFPMPVISRRRDRVSALFQCVSKRPGYCWKCKIVRRH